MSRVESFTSLCRAVGRLTAEVADTLMPPPMLPQLTVDGPPDYRRTFTHGDTTVVDDRDWSAMSDDEYNDALMDESDDDPQVFALACGDRLGAYTCNLPVGHDGPHERQLPDGAADVIWSSAARTAEGAAPRGAAVRSQPTPPAATSQASGGDCGHKTCQMVAWPKCLKALALQPLSRDTRPPRSPDLGRRGPDPCLPAPATHADINFLGGILRLLTNHEADPEYRENFGVEADQFRDYYIPHLGDLITRLETHV